MSLQDMRTAPSWQFRTARETVFNVIERTDLSVGARFVYVALLAWPEYPEREPPYEQSVAKVVGMPQDELVGAGLVLIFDNPLFRAAPLYEADDRRLVTHPDCPWRREPETPTPPAMPRKAKITQTLRRQVFERDAYRCRSCNTHLGLSVDHIIPESKGGPTTLDNLQCLCQPCNSRKGAR